MTRIRSSLARHQPVSPTGPEKIDAWREAAWHEQHVLVVPMEKLTNWDDRQYLENIGNQLYGARK